MATPLYFFTMNAQMKTMIDRTLGGVQKPGLENKDFYLIATAADGRAAMERTIDGLRGYLDCLPGAREKGGHLWSRRMAARRYFEKSCHGGSVSDGVEYLRNRYSALLKRRLVGININSHHRVKPTV